MPSVAVFYYKYFISFEFHYLRCEGGRSEIPTRNSQKRWIGNYLSIYRIQWRKAFTHLTTKSKPNENDLFKLVPAFPNRRYIQFINWNSYYFHRMFRTSSLFKSQFFFYYAKLELNQKRNERLAIIINCIRFWSAHQLNQWY